MVPFADWTRRPTDRLLPGRHLLEEPHIPAEFVTNLDSLISRLEARTPDGLTSKRNTFRHLGRRPHRHDAFTELWRIRAELVVADRLLQNGVELTIKKATPDFECRFAGHSFGVEVTTRLPTPIGDILRDHLAQELPAGTVYSVRLNRSHPPVFALSKEVAATAIDQLVTAVKAAVAAEGEEGRASSLPLPQAGMSAEITTANVHGNDVQVTERGQPDSAYWQATAWEVASCVAKKVTKTYTVDSVLAIDVTRLGWCGRWPIDQAWTVFFDEVLDACDWGPLKGIVLFRSWLWDGADPAANTVQVVTACGTDLAALVSALLSGSPGDPPQIT